MPHTHTAAHGGSGVPVLDDEKMAQILRRVRYAHLSEAQFELLIATCQRRGLDPWLDHVACEGKPGGRRNEILIVVTLQALRDAAESTGEYGEQHGPFWCAADGQWRDVWTAKQPPAAAKVGVTRAGRKAVYWGVANWDSFAQVIAGPHGETALADFWEKMGPHMLAKCATALALRAAFPRQLGGLYTFDEMGQAHNPPRRRGAPVVDDSTPTSDFLFQLHLSRDFDLTNPREREETIRRMKAKFPGLYAHDRRGFFAASLHELTRERTEGCTA